MLKDIRAMAVIGSVLAALGAAPAVAQANLGDWDADGNGSVSEKEFNDGWKNIRGDKGSVFEAWDEDGDGVLSEDEYNAGVFNSYDADDSGAIEEPEFGDVGDDMGDGGFWDV